MSSNHPVRPLVISLITLALLVWMGVAVGIAQESETKWVVGFTMPTAQNVTIQAVANGMEAEGKLHGIQLIRVDDQLSIDKQIADVDQLIAQQVDAIVVWPMDPKGLLGVLDRAEKKGIALFAHDLAFREGETQGPITTQVLEGRKQQAREAVEYIRDKSGGTGSVVGITIGPPVPTHLYLFEQFEAMLAEMPGMKFLEKQGNPTDDAAGARPLMENLLTKYPKIDAVYTYNDPSAIGAATAAKAAGRREEMVILGYNGGPDGIDAVQSGLIDVTWDYMPVEIGQTLMRAAWLVLSGQKKPEEMPDRLVMPVQRYSRENIEKFVPWDERVKMIEKGAYLGIPLE